MNKTVIHWKPVALEDPSDRSKTIYVPTIVERNQTKTLSEVVYSAIDRGLIAGLKTSAAQAIAEGILVQLGQELNAAHGVVFGDFFAVRAYLTGTVEGYTAPLTAENKLSTKFVAGSALRLDRKDFAFRNVLETGDAPWIDEVQSTEVGAEAGSIKVDDYPQLIGSNPKLNEGDSVKVYNVPAEGPETLVATLGPGDMRQNTNAVLVLDNKDLDLHAGQRYGFVVERTVALDEGKTAVVQSNEATALAVA
jgi:hypothetical protein